jgi:flagellar basal body-associated protein FliL
MADDEKTDSKDGKEKGGMAGKLKLVGVIVATLGVAYFLFGRGGASAETPVTTTTIPLSEEAEGAIVTAGTLTVNLADETPRYAKVGVALVLVEGSDPLQVESKLPLILDAVLSHVSNMTAEQLLSPSGFETLRQTLTTAAAEIYNETPDDGSPEIRVVKRVVLTELLVQ